nr:dihydroxy-acid dehydratase [Gelria sp. Kuro-4]
MTDGRFSGATRGAAIGHFSLEAFEGGQIAPGLSGVPRNQKLSVGILHGTRRWFLLRVTGRLCSSLERWRIK